MAIRMVENGIEIRKNGLVLTIPLEWLEEEFFENFVFLRVFLSLIETGEICG